jgi:uncharacterized protein (DUF2141 family)
MRTHLQQMRSPMTRKPGQTARVHRGIALFSATLTILIALVALAPLTGIGQPSLRGHRLQANGSISESSQPSSPLFQLAGAYDTGGSGPWAVATADLNADGKLDVVVTNPNSGTVGVLLGNGHGWFESPLKYNPGVGAPWSVAIGDLNGDGIPDIVVASNTSRDCGIDVLLGNGDGTFRTALTYVLSAGCFAQSVVIADLNGDGKLDVAVLLGGIAVLLGNGDGSFQPAVTYGGVSEYGSDPNSLAVADVNGDRKLDLVVAGIVPGSAIHGIVGVLLSNGDGTFQPAVDYDSGGGLYSYGSSVAVADLNGDGKPDIAVTNDCISSLCGNVGVLVGNGDGTFQPAVTYGPGGLQPRSIVIADVNADGKPDLVVANGCASSPCTTGGVGVLVGNGNSTFQPAVTYTATQGALGAAVADVNGDGKLDVVVAETTQVGVLLTNTGVVTKTAVTTSGSPTLFGQTVTFTAKVTPNQGTIPDGELMAFYDGITMLGTEKLAGGMAAYSTSSLSAKTHTIKATYVGDATFRLGSWAVQQAVLKDPTTTTLSSSLNPSNYGQGVTLTAKVTPAGPAPTGTVTFKNGSATLGNGTLNASGVATWTTPKIPVGANPLTSTYNGDAFNAKSVSAAITQTVSQASVRMALTSTPNPSTFGKSVKFTATLTSNGRLPIGQPVTFSYNGATLGTVNVNSTGVAIFSTTSLPRGSDVVTAAYAGSVDYSSASATITQAVN